MKKPVLVLAALVCLLAAAGASAQAFSTTRGKGMFEVKLQSNSAGVTVTIDGQSAGTIPVTVYVTPGQHMFGFQMAGTPANVLPLNIKSDTVMPYNPVIKTYPLTVSVNVPGASLILDNQPMVGNSVGVTAGNHTLVVSARGYTPVTQPFTMPPNATNLSITLQGSAYPLTVSVNVPGATLTLDNLPMASNPTNVSAGPHTLVVIAPGYNPVTQPFTMPPNATNLSINLIAAMFPLNVSVNVPGASVYVDNAPTDNPAMVSLGSHVVSVAAPGYQPFSQAITMTNRGLTLPVTLVPSAFPLTLQVNVPGSQVFLDNQQVTGLSLALSPGNHTLMVTAGGYQMYTQTFTMPANATTLSVTLLAELGTLVINADNWVAKGNQKSIRVYVNGVEQKERPLTLSLPQGSYDIRLEVGFVSTSGRVTVVPGKSVTLMARTVLDVVQ